MVYAGPIIQIAFLLQWPQAFCAFRPLLRTVMVVLLNKILVLMDKVFIFKENYTFSR